MKLRSSARCFNLLLLVALLLGTGLPAAPIRAQAPEPPGSVVAPSEGALRMTLPDVAAPPEAPVVQEVQTPPVDPTLAVPEGEQALMSCSAPATIPFGRDLELTLGPLNTANNFTAQSVTLTPAWGSTYQSTWITGTMTAVNCVGTTPGPEQVFFYKDMNYSGTCKMLEIGKYPSSSNIGVGNDELTSVKVGANVDLLLCRDKDYGGICETFTGNDSNIGIGNDIGNDTVTSAKVTLAPHAYGIAAATLGTDAMQVVMRTGSNRLVAQTWNPTNSWGPLVDLGLAVGDTPAAVSRTPETYSVVARSGTALKVMHGDANGFSMVWQDVPGGYDPDIQQTIPVTDAVGSPAMVTLGPYQLTLFYRTSGGDIKYNEWQSGYGWRQTPISLGRPSSTALTVDPVAVARDENHIAVFVVVDSRVYVKEWSTANASDWSDTTWSALTSTSSFSAKAVPPAVASRHRTHVGVGVLSSTGEIWFLEWTASATTEGWSAPTKLDGTLNTLSLAATSTEEMFLFGVNSSGYYFTKKWTRDGGWGSWGSGGSGWASGAPAPVGVAPRVRELVVFGRSSSNRLQVKSHLALNAIPVAASLANSLYGTPRSQVITTFDARTYWVSAYRSDTDGKWYLAAKSTETWNGYTLQLSAHLNADVASNKVSVAAADMNRDGDDEIVVATLKADGSAAQVSVFQLVVNSTGAVTGITSKATTSFVLSGSTLADINVAVGNLSNGSSTGVADEIAVVALRNGYNQVRVGVYRFTGSSLSALASQTLDVNGLPKDLEMTIAQIDGTATEKIIFGVQGTTSASLYRYRLSGTTLVSDVDVAMVPFFDFGAGPYTSAMASGDVDSDGLEEVIYTGSHLIITYPSGGLAAVPAVGSRSLAVGDINMDGLAEVVLSTASESLILRNSKIGDTQFYIRLSGVPVTGVPLLADIDGDSLVGSYKGCSEFKEVQVVTVANSQPQWSTSARNNEGAVFNTNTETEGDEYAWETSFGGSVTVGFEQDVSFIVKLASVSSSVSVELMGSVGGGKTHEESQATLSGGSYDGESANGVVCYTQTGYTCYAYDVTDPDTGVTSSAMACPTRSLGGQAVQVCEPLSDWYQLTRPVAGDSWAPVGHRILVQGQITNTLDLSIEGNYAPPNPDANGRTQPPVDPYLVWWDGWDLRKDVKASTDPTGSGQTWEIQRESSVGTTEHYGFETSITQSSGVGVAGFTVERSLTVGFGNEWNSSVTWSNGLGFSGEVYNYPTGCSFCQTYTIAPFVYRSQAVTLGGARYPYLEQDYYLTYAPWLTNSRNELGRAPAASAMEAETALAGTPPQAPVVTSSTHPDPDTWYVGNTVVFNWAQPAGDPGVVTGYKWDLNQIAVFTPTAAARMTTTTTFNNLADGVYYLHLRAEGNGTDHSPVVHRRVLVDNTAPQVEFLTDPLWPNGFNGWFVSPVAVNVAATDTVGSGVTGIETSTDGNTWLPYTESVAFTADTPGAVLWARATDTVGHTSEPVSTTIRIDQAAPSTYDEDGYGLSYASIITDEVGNAQLVLGGQLSDALSGNLQVEMKAGNIGLWHTVNATGNFPMLPGNEFSTTISTLQWIYTPTFNVRGVYPLWGRGVDAAGNYEDPWIHGVFWWEPDDVPELLESQVSASPRQAYAGDVVAFTVGARNSGYQEAQLLITNTVPAGLTVVPGSISDQGFYNPSTRVIAWTLDALWPGQMRYLTFNATADATTIPITVENQSALMAYWPWEPLPGVPPEPERHYYSTTTSVVILPGQAPAVASTPASTAPRVLNASVVEGALVSSPQVTLLVNATQSARALYVKEWVWDAALNAWNLTGGSGWVPFESAPGLEVFQDASGKYGHYAWTLSEGDGVKYLGVWVVDAEGQISNLNEGNLFYTNLVSANGHLLPAGERVQYRIPLDAGNLTLFNLVSLSGDADLYIWKPRAGFMPHYYSNAGPAASGLSLDTVGFWALEDGMYVMEVQAATDAYYRLISAGALDTAGTLAETQVNTAWASLTEGDWALLKQQDTLMVDVTQNLDSWKSAHLTLAEKERPAHPLTLSTPYTLGGATEPSESPQLPPDYATIFLPLVLKSSGAQ